jgi:hypothetical protein
MTEVTNPLYAEANVSPYSANIFTIKEDHGEEVHCPVCKEYVLVWDDCMRITFREEMSDEPLF